MNLALAEAVVRCLHVSADRSEAAQLRRFSLRDWKRTLGWLDNSGLALYLHRRLNDWGATDVLPPTVLARLDQNLADNRRRVDRMTQQLGVLHEGFDRAGVKYVLLKGFSLVPDFCPDAELRAPNDFDYLIDAESVSAAQRALQEAGYRLTRCGHVELGFDKPPQRVPTPEDSPYDPRTEASIELHLEMWDSDEHQVHLESPGFAAGRLVTGEWRGLRFPVLEESEALLLQVLHVFQHLLHGWIKMCWLLEIGFFMNQKSADSAFWEKFNERLRGNPRLEEFAAIVTSMAAKMFCAWLPVAALEWNRRLGQAEHIWLERYAMIWIFGDHPFSESRWFPPAKLSLFLHQEYLQDRRTRQDYVQQRLFPWKRPPAIPAAIKTEPSDPAPRQMRFLLHLLTFHTGAGLRYLWELPRWRGLNRVTGSLQSAELPVADSRVVSTYE